jgi:hypothetical protein
MYVWVDLLLDIEVLSILAQDVHKNQGLKNIVVPITQLISPFKTILVTNITQSSISFKAQV